MTTSGQFKVRSGAQRRWPLTELRDTQGLVLSSISWSVDRHLGEDNETLISRLSGAVAWEVSAGRLRNWGVYLIAAKPFGQTTSAARRHQRFWGWPGAPASIRDRSLDEWEFDQGGLHRWAAIAEMDAATVEVALGYRLTNSTALLAFVPGNHPSSVQSLRAVARAATAATEGPVDAWLAAVAQSSRVGVLVGRLIGEFDDVVFEFEIVGESGLVEVVAGR